MLAKLFIALQYILPQHALSALMHKAARCTAPWFKNSLIKVFIHFFDVNMAEAKSSDPSSFESFNAFFTRELNDDARELTTTESDIACPVDGEISQIGSISNGEVFQAKGKSFNLDALLGSDTLAEAFTDGEFATIYLSPKDYHRIHFPVDGQLKKMIHVPGDLFSVNQTTVDGVGELFARNERVVAFFDTPKGPMAMVMVGAIFVSSIETVWYGEVTPPRQNQVRRWHYEPSENGYNKHDEMGRFNMGSTVVVLFGKNQVDWLESMANGQPVQLGEKLGTYK